MIFFENEMARNLVLRRLDEKYNAHCFFDNNTFVLSSKKLKTPLKIPIPELKRDGKSAESYVNREITEKYSAYLI